MKNIKYLHLSLMIIFMLLISVLSAQTIVKVEKTDQSTLNLLENLQVNLCFEMNDYVVISPSNLKVLDSKNIDYDVLTLDNTNLPLYIISVDKRLKLQDSSYIGEIVSNDEIRIEKVSDLSIDLSPKNGIKYIPVKISQKKYKNVKTEYIDNTYSNRDVPINDIIESVNADTISWYIQNLENFGTRYARHSNRKQVAQWIADQFIRFGYNDVYLDSFYVSNYQIWQYNVVCEVEGTDLPDKYVIIGGHHDSINNNGYDASMVSAPGADDNASGTAVVLETARVMKLHNYQPKSSLRFTTFAMEEFGLYGAYYDAESVVEQGLDVVAMINSDMIANQDGDNWAFAIRYYEGADFLTNISLDYADEYDMSMNLSTQYIANSDSWAYHNQGIPAIFFSENEFSPYYHTSNDLLEYCNMPYAEQFIRLISSVVMRVSDMPNMPENYNLTDMGNGTSLIAQWDALDAEDVIYRLVVEDLSDGTEVEFNTNENNYEISELTTGNYYKVTLFAQVGDYVSAGQSRIAAPLNIPRTVNNFKHTPQLSQILFDWSPNNEEDLQGYKIYRKTTDNDDFELLSTINAQDTVFVDNTTENGIWYDYTIVAYDNDENESDTSDIITTRHLSFNSGILVMDLTYNSDTSVLYPPKEEVDQFYRNITAGYDISESELELNDNIRIEDIGIYSTIIIHKNSFNTVSNMTLLEVLNQYITYGGNLIYTANDPIYFMHQIVASYPQSYYEGDIIYDYFNIAEVNNNNTARFYQGISTNWNNLPNLVVDPDKTLDNMDNKLFKIEALTTNTNNVPEDFEVLYLYDSNSDNQTEALFDSYVVAVYNQINDAKIVLMSIPLYFIEENQAFQFMQTILTEFGEETPINDNSTINKPLSLNLSNYPNPFNPTTTISFNLDKAEYANLSVYNIKGQLIKDFGKKQYPTGINEIVWNGEDNYGNQLSSGIYFYKLKTDTGLQQIKKMILLK